MYTQKNKKSNATKGFNRQGLSAQELIESKQAEYAEAGIELTEEEAFEEVIAAALEGIMADGRVLELLQAAEAKDKRLGAKVRQFFQNIGRMIRDTIRSYQDVAPESAEGRLIRQLEDIYSQLQEAFAEGVYDAGENFRKAENTTGEGGVRYATRENTDIPYKLYRKLLSKKQLKDTKKYYAKVKDARIEKYRGLVDDQIPDIDFLEIGEYKKLNEGYVYTVRNYDRDSFEIIGRNAINDKYAGYVMRSDHNGEVNQGIDIRNAQQGSNRGRHSDSDRLPGNPRAISKNSTRSEKSPAINEKRSFSTSNADSGQRSGLNKNIFQKIDSDGNPLTDGQQKCFAESKERDTNGNLQVMYRGDSEEVTVYDRKKSKPSNLYGRGFYYTKEKSHAGQYGIVRAFYLNTVNPLMPDQHNITKEQMLRFLEAIENDGEDYDLYNYGEGATAQSILEMVWGKGDFEMLQDVSASAVGDLVAAVELFNEINGTTYDSIRLPTETVIFNSNQAKLTTNKNPTDNPDIRYSIGRKTDKAAQEMASAYPDVFDAQINAGDMPVALGEIIDRLRNENTSALEYAHSRRWIEQDLIRDVYDSYWRVNNLRTVADRNAVQINRLKSKPKYTSCSCRGLSPGRACKMKENRL